MKSIKQEILIDAPFFRFHYLVPHADSELRDATPFQGFGEGLIASIGAFKYLTTFPTDLRELYANRQHIAFFRAIGKLPYVVYPIQLSSLPEAFAILPTVLPCILSTGSTTQVIDEFLAQVSRPALHLSIAGSVTSIPFREVTADTFRQYASKVVAFFENNQDIDRVISEFKDVMSSSVRCSPKTINLAHVPHNVTMPNETALRSIGLHLSGERPLTPGRSQEYIKAVVKSADFLARQRSEALAAQKMSVFVEGRIPQSAILCTAGYYDFRNADRHSGQGKESRLAQQIAKIIKMHEGYTVVVEEPIKKLMTPLGMAAASVRGSELRAFSFGLSIRAASHLVPVFRLPQFPADIKWQLIRLGGVVRNPQGQIPKRNRIAHAVGKLLRQGLPTEVVSRLPNLGRNLKIVSDWPLEWANIEGLPLMLRYNCSRITATPGNVCFSQLIDTDEVKLPLGAFSEILVIRSFQDSDPIKPVLWKALEESKRLNKACKFQVDLRLVDVATEDEFVAALNSYDGAMIIFDCHGTYDHSSDVGTLLIGGQRLDVWKLRGRAKVPPIVLLSACDTHPIDGSHASVANGMIALGAKTVLGTLLPIHAGHAAVFLGRLLLRIQEYIPTYLNAVSAPLRWVQVISGMQRMHYATEVINLVCGKFFEKITPQVVSALQFQANNFINTNDPKWFEKLKAEIVKRLEIPLKQLELILVAQGQLTEAIRYVQIGNPETIVILKPAYEEAFRNAASQAMAKH